MTFDELFNAMHPLQLHQADAIEFLDRTPRALLADDVGLGKTVEAIGHLCSLVANGDLVLGTDRIVWITSANLIEQTAQEFEKFAPIFGVLPQTDRWFKPSISPKEHQAFATYFCDGPDVFMVSHQYAAKSGDALLKRFGRPSAVLIDEAMALKGGGINHAGIRELIKAVPRILVMTATPFENDGMETYRLLQLLHLPNLWPEFDFKKRFIEWSDPYQIPGTYKVVPERPVGLRGESLGEFRELLHGRRPGHGVMLRRKAEDIGASLPVRVGDQLRWVKLNAVQKLAYDAIAAKGGTAHIAKTQIARQADGSSALVDALMGLLTHEIRERKGDRLLRNLGRPGASLRASRESPDRIRVGRGQS